ncbi:MAG: zf-HC2 domain-containing protein [Bryobacteraceae bacterium]
MISCSEIRPRIALYIDREVTGAEALELEAHLTQCAECRRVYEDVRGTVDAVRGARPLYDVPDESFAAVQAMVSHWQWRQKQRRWILAAAVAVLLLAVALPWISSRRSAYEEFAAQAHRNFERGTFPLDVASSQPQVVAAWLEPRVPFRLTLPDYPEGGPKRYALAGARLMQYRGEDVAYLAYEMDQKPISLLISSSSRIMPAGGESYQSAGLTFYFSAQQGLRIISWKDKGLTYAQVSDLAVQGAESCAICHGAERDRRKFEGLGKRL